ncbi:hypothetical protein [Altererythrobacter sp. MF3-039]|uniref:hypothetical protein n=1 Tax=Altererythrobacter sp. MF3-039 TaxID=3252901 RepID=UPI00390C6E6F
MSSFEILAIIGIAATVAVIIYIVATQVETGSPLLAAALSLGFGGYTFLTMSREGADILWANHTETFWGVQVWWDLLISVSLALFLIAPRARARGMKILPWALFVAATASIGLLAMVARLFWLERHSES